MSGIITDIIMEGIGDEFRHDGFEKIKLGAVISKIPMQILIY